MNYISTYNISQLSQGLLWKPLLTNWKQAPDYKQSQVARQTFVAQQSDVAFHKHLSEKLLDYIFTMQIINNSFCFLEGLREVGKT